MEKILRVPEVPKSGAPTAAQENTKKGFARTSLAVVAAFGTWLTNGLPLSGDNDGFVSNAHAAQQKKQGKKKAPSATANKKEIFTISRISDTKPCLINSALGHVEGKIHDNKKHTLVTKKGVNLSGTSGSCTGAFATGGKGDKMYREYTTSGNASMPQGGTFFVDQGSIIEQIVIADPAPVIAAPAPVIAAPAPVAAPATTKKSDPFSGFSLGAGVEGSGKYGAEAVGTVGYTNGQFAIEVGGGKGSKVLAEYFTAMGFTVDLQGTKLIISGFAGKRKVDFKEGGFDIKGEQFSAVGRAEIILNKTLFENITFKSTGITLRLVDGKGSEIKGGNVIISTNELGEIFKTVFEANKTTELTADATIGIGDKFEVKGGAGVQSTNGKKEPVIILKATYKDEATGAFKVSIFAEKRGDINTVGAEASVERQIIEGHCGTFAGQVSNSKETGISGGVEFSTNIDGKTLCKEGNTGNTGGNDSIKSHVANLRIESRRIMNVTPLGKVKTTKVVQQEQQPGNGTSNGTSIDIIDRPSSCTVGIPCTFRIRILDIDGVYSATIDGRELAFGEYGEDYDSFQYTLIPLAPGRITKTIEVTDYNGNVTSRSFDINVLPGSPSTNTDSSVNVFGPERCTVGVECQYSVEVTDPDGVTSVKIDGTELTRVSGTNTYTYRHTPGAAGETIKTVVVRDGRGNTTNKPFTIISVNATTTGTNRPPVFAANQNFISTATPGVAYNWACTASDPDGDGLRYTMDNKPNWASFNQTNCTLSGTPQLTDVGVHNNIRVLVNDGHQALATAVNLGSLEVRSVSFSFSSYRPSVSQSGSQIVVTLSIPDAAIRGRMTNETFKLRTPTGQVLTIEGPTGQGIINGLTNTTGNTGFDGTYTVWDEATDNVTGQTGVRSGETSFNIRNGTYIGG